MLFFVILRYEGSIIELCSRQCWCCHQHSTAWSRW